GASRRFFRMNLQQTVVGPKSAGIRLDLFLTRCFADRTQADGFSRSGIQRLISQGQITINGKPAKASVRLKTNDLVAIEALPLKKSNLAGEAIALSVIYEDGDCLVINKAPGIVVHPAAGRTTGTLVNAILHRCPDLQGIGGELRPGIVHRLDKDTSGVMIIAKSRLAFQKLGQQFKTGTVKKQYVALVWGKPKERHGIIDRPIGRHRWDRKRMSSLHPLPRKRQAVTEWTVERFFQSKDQAQDLYCVSLLRLTPKTGRTHQIRVHLADLGYPIVGDSVYGRKRGPHSTVKNAAVSYLDSFLRQALHAERLSLLHPRTGTPMEFYAPLAEDIENLLKRLDGSGVTQASENKQ
ncbi:MAG TPA: RluA family pseudouridine synthase, partial [Candidatus Binatia bacterium]|nr:RluA family pseudouridine synthase [Candidatus Binatia bacterium]